MCICITESLCATAEIETTLQISYFFYKFLSDWINAICSNIDEPRDIILSKPDRERQISLDITYMYNIKNDTNELIKFMNIKPKYTHRHKE